MMFFFLFIYSIMAYGVANALVYFNGPFGFISRFREWISSKHDTFDELFSCMFCLPTNIGIILSILSLVLGPFTPFTVVIEANVFTWPLVVFFDGLYTGGIVYLIHTIQQKLERND